MHQCLRVDDIVRLVVEKTVNLERPSAISLACTFRVFEAAVMEILWGSHQTDIVDLLQCFPSEVWEIQELGSGRLYFVWMRLFLWRLPIHADSWLFVHFIGFQTIPIALGMGTGQSTCKMGAQPQHLRGFDGTKPVTKGVAGVERH